MNPEVILSTVQHYADRGIFRRVNNRPDGRGVGFTWMFDAFPLMLVWNTKTETVQFKDVLTGVEARSQFQTELKAFLTGLFDESLPEHRRLDREKVSLTMTRRDGAVSIGLKLISASEDYAVRRLINLTHEMFLYLRLRWPEYMHEQFKLPEE
jgi:hypothetical protein